MKHVTKPWLSAYSQTLLKKGYLSSWALIKKGLVISTFVKEGWTDDGWPGGTKRYYEVYDYSLTEKGKRIARQLGASISG